MSLIEHVQPHNLGNALLNLASSARTAAELGNAAAQIAKRIRNNLPDIKKEKNLARTTFERKINMPAKSTRSTVTGNQTANRALVDVSRSQSGAPQMQRSSTGSRQIGLSTNGNKTRVPKGLPGYLDRIRVCFRASTPLINNFLNQASYSYAISVDSPGTDLSSIMPQLIAMQALYREFKCLKLAVDFVPRVGSTVAGIVAGCVDRDPRASTASTSTIIRKDPFFESDLKQPGSLTWMPVDNEDKRYRYTVDAARPLEFLSHGVLLVTSNNDQALAATVGELFIDGWFEFAIPL
jgi:hypothetical protein